MNIFTVVTDETKISWILLSDKFENISTLILSNKLIFIQNKLNLGALVRVDKFV